MRLKIESSKSFDKKLAKLLKKNPSLMEPFFSLIQQITENPFISQLKTHPLPGDLAGKFSCSLTYDLRIIFN